MPEPSRAQSDVWARPDPLPPSEHDPSEHDPSEHDPAVHQPLHQEPAPGAPAAPAAETRVHGLNRWFFAAVLVVVWIPAAAAGAGLYYWWFHSVDKTWPVFVVLIFVGVCTLCAMLAAMVNDKPLVSALALAVMAAPLAAVAAAAVLHGSYFCDRVGPLPGWVDSLLTLAPY